jgi:hypothetical protein
MSSAYPEELPIVVLYDGNMVTQAALPDEAVDMTGSELHHRVVNRLVDVLRFIFGARALVLSDVFLRVRGDPDVQASPDLAIIPEAQPGTRTVYWIPDEPVPATTIEVLSPANHRSDGAAILADKRALFGRIGVATHIEIDPDRGAITTWAHNGTELEEGDPITSCEHPALGGLRIEASPAQVRLFLPDGREFVDAQTEMARVQTETARVERLSEALRQAGIDPTTI